MTVDPYNSLGLTRSATPDDVKNAYRKLVRTGHPDLHPDDAEAEARFKAIAAAHDLQKDRDTRSQHPVFRRIDDDVFVTLPITIDEAILGGKVKAPTISGPVNLTIPKGASSGRVLRLRGRGISHPGGMTGDQPVDLKVVTHPGNRWILARLPDRMAQEPFP